MIHKQDITLPGQRIRRWTVLLVWLGVVTVSFAYVHLYGSPIPQADEWAMAEQAFGTRPITVDWLWSLHNEHRLPLTRLLYSGLLRLTGNNVRAVMFFDVAILAAVCLILVIFTIRFEIEISYPNTTVRVKNMTLLLPKHGVTTVK